MTLGSTTGHLQQGTDPTAATPSHRRLDFLDVVRGIAALSVLLQHLLESSFPRWNDVVGIRFNLGIFGVAAFFIVSGFIIPASLEKYATLARFWRGRVFRLYPMYLFALAAVLGMGCFGLFFVPPARHPALAIAANLTMVEEFFGFTPILSVSWTLCLEMVFYVLCSFVFWKGWLKYSFRLAIIAIAFVCLGFLASLITHHPLPAGQIGLLATCFFGTLLYRVYKGEAGRRCLWLFVPFFAALLASFWLRFNFNPLDPSAGSSPFTFTCVADSWAAAYVFFFLLFYLRSRAFPSALAWLGKVSYSFYLFAGFIPWLLPRKFGPWFWIAESLLTCVLLSAITYRWIERPFMLLGAPPRPLPRQTPA